MFCNIPAENAIPNLTAPILYEVPLMLEQEGLARRGGASACGLDCTRSLT